MNPNEPKYRAICDLLKKEILSGKYTVDAFPSEVALSRRFKTGRSTVKRALGELHHLGLVRSHQGRGTFVTRQAVSRKIGLIVPGVVYSEFFPPIVDEVSRLSQENGYVLLYAGVESKKQSQSVKNAIEFAKKLEKEDVAGVIFQPFEFLSEGASHNKGILDLFERAHIPVVLLGYDIEIPPQRSKCDVVGINNADAGFRLAESLMAQGAKKIRFLMPPSMENSPAAYNRLRGVMTALGSRANKSVLRQDVVLNIAPGDSKALKRALGRKCPDAFICCNDAVAAAFRQTLGKLKLSVPNDVLLAGFDDVNIARLSYPPLTSIHQPCIEIARTAFSRLLERIAEPDLPPLEMLLPAPVVERESSLKVK